MRGAVFLAPNYLSHINVHEELFGAETLEEYNSARNSIGLKSIDSLKDYYFFPTKLFGVWPEWFAPKEADWPENLALLGFINKETAAEDDFPEEIEELLASDKKKVLITGGTSKFVRKEFYELAQSGVAETDCCGIMVIPFESQLPENTPDNIVLVREACVSRLMFHVDAVIHHGGMGTSSEAIVAGVPQIILSHIIDGRDNAFRLQELGAAVNIPVSRWKQEYIQKALEYIFSGKMAESCMDVRQKYNDDHFDRNLIREAERVMRGDTDLNNDIRHEKADGAVNRKNVMDEKIRKAILRSISKRR